MTTIPTEWPECNLQIKTVSAVKSTEELEVKFRVINNSTGDDTARMVRVIILLPVNVYVNNVDVDERKKGLDGYAEHSNCEGCKHCEVKWNASVIIGRPQGDRTIYYDSTVSVDLGYMNRHFDTDDAGPSDKEEAIITVRTTLPNLAAIPNPILFGAFVYGSVPDNDPKKNYTVAECM